MTHRLIAEPLQLIRELFDVADPTVLLAVADDALRALVADADDPG